MRRTSFVLWALMASAALESCYAPDLKQLVYLCDVGKCPENFYCYDGMHCTQKLEECRDSGILVEDQVAVCISPRPPMGSLPTACRDAYMARKCDDLKIPARESLCTKPSSSGTLDTAPHQCSYCCL